MDVVYTAYQSLHTGAKIVSNNNELFNIFLILAALELNKTLGFLLSDKETLNDEIKMKYQNIMKMLLYIYIETVLAIEKKNLGKNDQLIRTKKKALQSKDDFLLPKNDVLLLFYNIIEREISLFWESSIVEESFINQISGVCYQLLKNPAIKNEKEALTMLFNIIGILIKNYSHGSTFVLKITHLIKLYEHLVQCIPKGVQQIVENFNCKGVIHEIVTELTEWQIDDKSTDSQVRFMQFALLVNC